MLNYIDSESIDFGFAMYAIVHKKRLRLDNPQGDMKDHSQVVMAISQMEASISVTRFRQLSDLVNKYFFHGLVHGLACAYPKDSEIDLIDRIKAYNAEAFFENYILYVLHTKETDEVVIKDEIQNLNQNNIDKSAPSFTAVKYLKGHISMFQEELVDFLFYFEKVYREVKQIIRPLVVEALTVFKASMCDVNALMEIIPVLDESILPSDYQLDVFVTGMIDSGFYIHKYDDRLEMILGVSLTYLLSDEFKEDQQLQFYKCLAEPTKLKILNLIKNEKLCAADIVKQLKMSKSNISHHLSQLATSRLIQLAEKDGKKAYYTVTTQFMEEMFERTLKQYKDIEAKSE